MQFANRASESVEVAINIVLHYMKLQLDSTGTCTSIMFMDLCSAQQVSQPCCRMSDGSPSSWQTRCEAGKHIGFLDHQNQFRTRLLVHFICHWKMETPTSKSDILSRKTKLKLQVRNQCNRMVSEWMPYLFYHLYCCHYACSIKLLQVWLVFSRWWLWAQNTAKNNVFIIAEIVTVAMVAIENTKVHWQETKTNWPQWLYHSNLFKWSCKDNWTQHVFFPPALHPEHINTSPH